MSHMDQQANEPNPLLENTKKEQLDTKKCIKCGAYIPSNAKKCMYCRSNQRSKLEIVVFGSLKLLLAILLVSLILQGLVSLLNEHKSSFTTSSSSDQNWKRFNSPNKDFSIIFPSTPETKTSSSSSATKDSIILLSRADKDTMYLVREDFAARSLEIHSNNIFSRLVSIQKSNGSSILSQEHQSFRGHPSDDIMYLTKDKVYAWVRFIIVGNRMYQLAEMSHKKFPSPKYFWNSFQFRQ